MNNKVLNVVSVFFSIPFFFGDQLSYFREKGYEIHIICSPSFKLAAYSEVHGFRFNEIEILRKFSVFKDIQSIWKIMKYIKRNDIDIVCGHTPKGALLSMIASSLVGVEKRIFFRHGLVYETSTGFKKVLLKNIERLTSLLSTKVICVSPYLIEKSIEDKLTKKEKMTLLNIGSCNGVDLDKKFNPKKIDYSRLNKLKKRLAISDENLIIGYTGRLVKDKGIPQLIEAFLLLKPKYVDLKLLLIGPFEKKNPIPSNFIDIIENNKDILALGLIEKNIEYYYALMNILVLPTLREGFGTSILEASAMELPILTTSHTGSRDAIVENETGLYVLPNSKSIANQIEKYLLKPVLREEHGKSGRFLMEREFDQKIIWKEIEEKIYLD